MVTARLLSNVVIPYNLFIYFASSALQCSFPTTLPDASSRDCCLLGSMFFFKKMLSLKMFCGRIRITSLHVIKWVEGYLSLMILPCITAEKSTAEKSVTSFTLHDEGAWNNCPSLSLCSTLPAFCAPLCFIRTSFILLSSWMDVVFGHDVFWSTSSSHTWIFVFISGRLRTLGLNVLCFRSTLFWKDQPVVKHAGYFSPNLSVSLSVCWHWTLMWYMIFFR